MKYILNQGGTIEFFSPSSGNVVTIKEDGKVYINGIGGYDGTNPESASTIQEESVFEKGTGANSAQLKGTDAVASGDNSHAEGARTKAIAHYSHAEGYNTKASGSTSHAEGLDTTASGISSHAEGWGTSANGNYSHAEGNATKANGNYSHTEGFHTSASENYSHAEGTYNFADYNFIHMVGIGDAESNRLNAHTITTNGLHYILGVGGYTGQGTSGATDLATVISSLSSFESLSEVDYNIIYGKIPVSDIGIIAFDDYPQDIVREILEEYHVQDLSELASFAKDDPGCTGENWLTNTGSYLEYDGDTYELWRGHAGAVGSSPVLGLLPIGTTYAQLSPLSIEADETNKYCPFAAMCFNNNSSDWGDGKIYEQDGEAFSLLYVTPKQ